MFICHLRGLHESPVQLKHSIDLRQRINLLCQLSGMLNRCKVMNFWTRTHPRWWMLSFRIEGTGVVLMTFSWYINLLCSNSESKRPNLHKRTSSILVMRWPRDCLQDSKVTTAMRSVVYGSDNNFSYCGSFLKGLFRLTFLFIRESIGVVVVGTTHPSLADYMKLPIARVQPAPAFHRVRYPRVFGMFSRVFAILPMRYKSDRTLEGRVN